MLLPSTALSAVYVSVVDDWEAALFKAQFFRSPYLYLTEKERVREMFYLTTHSTHFIYGVRHMVKDHSDSEKGNPLPPHRLLLSINSKGSFICTIPQTG